MYSKVLTWKEKELRQQHFVYQLSKVAYISLVADRIGAGAGAGAGAKSDVVERRELF